MQQLKHIKNKKKESWQIKKFREQIVVNVKCDEQLLVQLWVETKRFVPLLAQLERAKKR